MFRNSVIIGVIFSLFLLFASAKAHAQHDADTLYNVLIQYKLKQGFLVDTAQADTSFNRFYVFKYPEKNSISGIDLGNLGSASRSNVFMDSYQTSDNEFTFLNPYSLYIANAKNNVYFNTRRPYTEVFHSMSSKVKEEQTLRFTHTQNINPLFNVGLDYHLIASLGEYPEQQVKKHSLTFHGNYEKKRYSLHAAFFYNNFKLEENGGVLDTMSQVDMNTLTTFLSGATSKMIERDVFASQKFLFGKVKKYAFLDTTTERVNAYFSIGHSLEVRRQYRLYEDAETAVKGYYQYFFLTPAITYDSVAYRHIENRISFNSERYFTKKTGIELTAGIGNVSRKYFNFVDYISYNYLTYFSDILIFAEARKQLFDTWHLSGSAKQFMSGYRAGDFRYLAQLTKSASDSSRFAFDIGVMSESRAQDFFVNRYYSNHYAWDTLFAPTKTQRVELRTGFPKNSFEVRGSYTLLTDYLYYRYDAYPAQYSDNLTVLSASLRKDFHFKHLHLYNMVVWQKTSNPDILSLPEFVYYHGLAFELRYKTHLRLQFGYEVSMSSVYKNSGFNPALGQFYNNYSESVGSYPVINAFVNAGIKKNVMLFYKMEHLNSGMIVPLYTPVAHYPVKNRIWKIGVKWTFKN